METFIKKLIVLLSIFISASSHTQAGNPILETKTELKAVVALNSAQKEVKDSVIKEHLEKIFATTGWYPNLQLEVSEGLVILMGQIENQDTKDWALKIIDKTEGVIAVIDKLDSSISSDSVLKPAQDEVSKMYSQAYKKLPYIASAFILLFVFILLGYLFRKTTQVYLTRRRQNPLLVKSIANIVGVFFFILGFYFALKASGLSALAVTLLGGTGMLGIGLGLALKSTFENYTSSLMISLKELLRIGELVNINGFEGIVQSVTTRGTTLLDYDGNNIIIPNTDVFNSPIKNLTRNPKMRANFVVGIGYNDDINHARTIVMMILKKLQPAVLGDPEAIVAVDNLGSATVNLKVYFWFDAINVSLIKIKSLVIQSVKEALIQGNVTMPDDAREVVFASPLLIQNISADLAAGSSLKPPQIKPAPSFNIPQNIPPSEKEISGHDLENEV